MGMEDMMNHTVAEREMVNELRINLANLGEQDQNFAKSLVNNSDKYNRLSPKQMFWVEKLRDRANGKTDTDASKVEILGDFQNIKKLFDTGIANGNFKRMPKITIGYTGANDTFQAIRLSVATSRAKVPGSVNVVGVATGNWYGRIVEDGGFQQSYKFPAPKKMIGLLKEFTENPAEVAARSGQISKSCSFCNKTLTDLRSREVGYGPICAGYYKLPWGE